MTNPINQKDVSVLLEMLKGEHACAQRYSAIDSNAYKSFYESTKRDLNALESLIAENKDTNYLFNEAIKLSEVRRIENAYQAEVINNRDGVIKKLRKDLYRINTLLEDAFCNADGQELDISPGDLIEAAEIASEYK